MIVLPTKEEADKVRHEIIQLQQWVATFTENDQRISNLKFHLHQVRIDLEKLI